MYKYFAEICWENGTDFDKDSVTYVDNTTFFRTDIYKYKYLSSEVVD